MLPSTHRLRRSADFGAAVRGGRRAGARSLVVHAARELVADEPPRMGFVVSKAVGGAVVRNRTKRRLRALARPIVGQLPPGSRVVVRANPAAASLATPALDRDLRGALTRLGLPVAQPVAAADPPSAAGAVP